MSASIDNKIITGLAGIEACIRISAARDKILTCSLAAEPQVIKVIYDTAVHDTMHQIQEQFYLVPKTEMNENEDVPVEIEFPEMSYTRELYRCYHDLVNN